MSNILNTNCDDAEVVFTMDENSHPHCVWIDGGFVKYSCHHGSEWRLAGNSSVAVSSSDTLLLSKNCMGFNAQGNCFFSYKDGEDLKTASWNGASWTIEKITDETTVGSILAWSACWSGFSVVMAIVENAGVKSLVEFDNSTGSWVSSGSVAIPAQDNSVVELKTAKVANWIYAFWNGEDVNSGMGWIGHASWDFNSSTWFYLPNKQIQMSLDEYEIMDLDFVVTDELLSSSSSSSESSLSSYLGGIGYMAIGTGFVVA